VPDASTNGRITREDAARLGRSSEPWSFLPIAAQILRQVPEDAEIRFLAAAAAARLGLRTLALGTLEPLIGLDGMPPEVDQLRTAVSGLPDDRVPTRELIDRARANLDAFVERVPALDAAFDHWASGLGARWVLRATDGNVVWTEGAPDAHAEPPRCDLTSVVSLVESRRASHDLVKRWRDEACEDPRPVVVEGLRPPWALSSAHDASPPDPTGRRYRIVVVESDPSAALDALSWTDLRSVLGDDRVTPIIGPDSIDGLEKWLGDHDSWALPSVVIQTPGSVESSLGAARDRVRAAIETQAQTIRRIRSRLDERLGTRDTRWWAQRYARAMSGAGDPLRVLVLTTRYSTYVRHGASDIAHAVMHHGHHAELVIEPDDTCALSSLGLARAVERSDPDLIVSINHPRRALGHDAVPDGIPWVCWVQDAMPHLFDAELGGAQGELDFVVGTIPVSLISQFGYPRERCLGFGVPASVGKFAKLGQPGEGNSGSGKIEQPATSQDPLECDILIASNHGETPERMAARLEHECVDSGAPRGLAIEICRSMRELVSSWDAGWLEHHLDDRLGAILERFGACEPVLVDRAKRTIARPFVNRLLRHKLAQVAADVAERHGLRLRVHGVGWEQSERVARFSRPPIEHGSALRDAYARAAVTLHTSSEWLFHQRLHECVLAGGVPAVMLTPEVVPFVLGYAARHALRTGMPTASRLDDRRLVTHAMDDPVSALTLALAQRIAPDDAELVEEPRPGAYNPGRTLSDGLVLYGDGTGDEPLPRAAHQTGELEHVRFLWAIADTMFRTTDELASIVLRARENRAWRSGIARQAASISSRSFSYEGCLRSILDLIAHNLDEAGTAREGERAGKPAAAA